MRPRWGGGAEPGCPVRAEALCQVGATRYTRESAHQRGPCSLCRKTPRGPPPQPPTASRVLRWRLRTPSGLRRVQGEEEGLRFPKTLYKMQRLRGSRQHPACMAGTDPPPRPLHRRGHKEHVEVSGTPGPFRAWSACRVRWGSQPASRCQSATCLRSPPRLSPLWSRARCAQRSGRGAQVQWG